MINDIQAPGLIQYYNIYKTTIIIMIMKNYKNYLYREQYTPCGKTTHKKNLELSQNL